MSLEGFIPYVNTISTFLTRRCYEQIFINCGLQNQKVRLIGNGGGVVYSPLGGHTQQLMTSISSGNTLI